jgi:hypothetical protein
MYNVFDIDQIQPTSELFQQFIEVVQKDIQESEILRNGSVKNMVEIEFNSTSATIYVPYWFAVFWEGRKPGKLPPVLKILHYVINYDLLSKCPDFLPKVPFSEDKQLRFAWAIAYEMKEVGNTLYRMINGGTARSSSSKKSTGAVRYNAKSLDIDTIVTEQRIDNFANLLSDNLALRVSSQIISNIPKKYIT